MDVMVGATPVKRISRCDKDDRELDRQCRNRRPRQNRQPDDYGGKVVIKPWGHEFLIFENDEVAVWFLSIKKDHATSMHCHPSKKTSLALLAGRALCNTFRRRNFLTAGDALIIDAAVFHSTKALSLDGIALIEIETPPAKLDLVRLHDHYGREHCGYEGCSQMVDQGLDRFGYVCFGAHDCDQRRFEMPGRWAIGMALYPTAEEFSRRFVPQPGAQYGVCRGKLVDRHRRNIVGVGELQPGALLSLVDGLTIAGETVLMDLSVFV